MLPILIAAALSFDQVLNSFDEFCTKAQIEVAHPLTDSMLTKKVVDPEHDLVLIRVQEHYVLKFVRGRVKSFTDLGENTNVRLSRLDPEDMKRWSEQPCLLNESSAREIAKGIFLRLGFEEKDFDPVEVHRYRWQPTPTDPEHVLWLPLFQVRWYQKGQPRDQAVPPAVTLDISGSNKKLVYYLDATERQRSFFSRAPAESSTVPTNGLSPELRSKLLSGFERLAKAANFNLPVAWQSQAKAFPTGTAGPSLHVGEGYIFELQNNRIERFTAHEKLIRDFHLDEDMPELGQWVAKPPVISQNGALEMATQIFRRMGFDEREFYPPQVKRAELAIPDPQHPDASLALPPSFWVTWPGKRPFWARQGSAEMVIMEISGATSNLIFYIHQPSDFRFWPW